MAKAERTVNPATATISSIDHSFFETPAAIGLPCVVSRMLQVVWRIPASAVKILLANQFQALGRQTLNGNASPRQRRESKGGSRAIGPLDDRAHIRYVPHVLPDMQKQAAERIERLLFRDAG